MQSNPKLDALTGLRFFAALMIVVHHVYGIWFPGDEIFALGSGVSFFFVLSGFILHYNYRDKTDISWPYFMWLRFWRLWPAHVAALLFAALMIPIGLMQSLPKLSWVEIGQVVFLLQSLSQDQNVYYAWNGPSWSISTEMFFYAAFPVLCLFAPRRPWLVLGIVASMAACFLIVAQYAFLDPSIRGNSHGWAGINPLPRLVEFTAGVVLCEMIVFRKVLRTVPGWIEFPVVILLVFGLWALNQSMPTLWRIGHVTGGYLMVAGLFPVYAILIAVMSFEAGPISRLVSKPVFVRLGEISFAIYLTHLPALYFFKRYLSSAEIWQTVPLYIAMVIGVSTAIYLYVEKPLIRWSRSAVSNRRTPTSHYENRPSGS